MIIGILKKNIFEDLNIPLESSLRELLYFGTKNKFLGENVTDLRFSAFKIFSVNSPEIIHTLYLLYYIE